MQIVDKWKKQVDKYFIKFQFNLIKIKKENYVINLLEKLKTTINLFHKRRNKRKKERNKHFIIKITIKNQTLKKQPLRMKLRKRQGIKIFAFNSIH